MMSNSFKILKYIFYFLMIVSLSLSITSKVNATTLAPGYLTLSNSDFSCNNAICEKQITGNHTYDFQPRLSSYATLGDYDSITGYIYVYNVDSSTNSSISLNGVNWSETCTSHTDDGSTYGNNGRIVYQDGSTAQIDYSQRTYYCNKWSGSSNSSSGTISESITDTSPVIQVTFVNSGGQVYPCETQATGYFVCPINNTSVLAGFNVRVYSGQTNQTIKIGINRWYNRLKDYQNVINNSITNNTNTQHQDSTTINNSIQDTNNTLKDDNVSGNNSSDTISSIGNTFDTENDFLLGLLTIPYNFFNSLVNIFENNCTSLNLGSMFGEDLVFPCLSLSNLLGDVFSNVIDVIFCGVIMSAFLRRIVKYYQALLSLDERATQIGGVKIW